MRKTTTLLVAVLTAGIAAVAPAGVDGRGKAVMQKRTGYGLTNGGSLVKFEAANTSRVRRVGTITGLAAGERLVGIDIRPVVGEIYGLGDKSNVYEINRRTGRATRKSSLTAAGGGAVTLRGSSFGIDFNPTSDRLRVTSDSGQNLRINVDSGVTATDGDLANRNGGGQPRVVGVAYSNNDGDSFLDRSQLVPAGRRATGTRLYAIDAARSSLAVQDPPNDGTLQTVGRLRRGTGSDVGFDIFSPVNGEGNTVGNVGYASLRRGGVTRLYKVNLRTGRTTAVRGGRGAFRTVKDIAIVP